MPESVAKLLEKVNANGYGDKRLSPKESEVLRLFAEGFLVTEIAKNSIVVSRLSVVRKNQP